MEKEALLALANKDFKDLMSDSGVKAINHANLTSQHDSANKHWDKLCKVQDMEDKAQLAEQVSVIIYV